MKADMNFGESLTRLRKSRGMSQEDLGDKLNVARQTVSKWETGETFPDLKKLTEMAELFDVSLDCLAGRSEKESETHTERETRTCGYYEYKSRKLFCGVPLVHINIGVASRHARGIIAVGNTASGVVAVGGAAAGVIAVGGVCAGLLSFGGLALGLIAALGGVALGTFAVGGFAVGILAIGGCAIGIYAMGGAAIAKNIAASMNGFASAHIAVGEHPSGEVNLIYGEVSGPELKRIILQEFPRTWSRIVSLFSIFFGV